MPAHGWLIVDLLEPGEIDAVDAQLEVLPAGAERRQQPLYLWNAASWGRAAEIAQELGLPMVQRRLPARP